MLDDVDPELIHEIGRGLMASGARAPRHLGEVPGWFDGVDQDLFEWILKDFAQILPEGDLVELGAFLGKSAIHMGRFLRGSEHFYVCDLFGTRPPDGSMSRSAQAFYSEPFRSTFERNYLRFHRRLPTIVQAPTAEILRYVTAGSCRFVHIDASHEYAQVSCDAQAARRLLAPGGVVAFDDYRAEHTPGTAAAVWEVVATGGLRPACLSEAKFYGTWGDPEALQQKVAARLAVDAGYTFAVHRVLGRDVIRVVRRRAGSASKDPHRNVLYGCAAASSTKSEIRPDTASR